MIYEKYVKENSASAKKKNSPNSDLINWIIKTIEHLITANNKLKQHKQNTIIYWKKPNNRGLLVSMLEQLEIKSGDLAIS